MSEASHRNGADGAHVPGGLSLDPFRALRPTAGEHRLGRLLSPPYDVIDADTKARLLAADPDNVVAVILPDLSGGDEAYAGAASRLDGWVKAGLFAVDESPTLYVYEMRETSGQATRGLVGAVELRDPADGVILPHENTMAGPVADRLALMTATGTDVEPIYLVYDGGGAASELVRTADQRATLATAVTPDGLTHRLWALTDRGDHRVVRGDLAGRSALIADGHHRYATYRERQRQRSREYGAGPWDRGLALLVDTSDYGPQVHAIHRVIADLTLEEAARRIVGWGQLSTPATSPEEALAACGAEPGFAAVLTDGKSTMLITDPAGHLAAAAQRPGAVAALTDLDATIVHRGLVEKAWGLPDSEDAVGYAHTVPEAIRAASGTGGIAVLLRPTPVAAVAAVAAAGARMPRKSTLFTPKPASGLVMRRLADQVS